MTAYATFTPQALHREEFATRQYTATADGKGGDLIQCADGLVGVVAGMKPYLNGDIITLRLVDAYDVPCASGTGFADGVDVYWNSSTKLAVATPPTPGFFIGPARGAKASGATAVRVLLNGGGMTLTSTTLSFTGSTGGNTIQVPNTLADALDIKDVAGNGYLQVNSTAGNVSLTGVSTGVTNAGGIVAVTGGAGGATSGTGGAVTITAGAGTNGNAAGGISSLTSGAGQGTGAGGAVTVTGGASGAGATGNGGAATVTAGAAASTNGTGGAASLIGGLGTGTGAGGAVTITSGAAGATGVAGAVNISVGGATAGNGSSVTITGGAGAGSTNAGGNVNLVGGAPVSTGTPGEVQVNGNSGLIPVQVALTATDASRAVFIATRACRLKAVSYMHTTGSTSGTLQIEKLTGTTAAGSGTVLLTGTIDLSATTVANTVVTGTLIATVASLTLAAGDRLSVKIAGTMTSLVGAIVTLMVAPA